MIASAVLIIKKLLVILIKFEIDLKMYAKTIIKVRFLIFFMYLQKCAKLQTPKLLQYSILFFLYNALYHYTCIIQIILFGAMKPVLAIF